jgi:transposase-like protein
MAFPAHTPLKGTPSDLGEFWPPYCTHQDCPQATAARRDGFFRHGYYTTRINGRRIPRFLCRTCRRTMSSQTFDETYRLRRPELEHAILKEIAQGASLRRVAQVLGINRKTVSRRLFRVRHHDAHIGISGREVVRGVGGSGRQVG